MSDEPTPPPTKLPVVLTTPYLSLLSLLLTKARVPRLKPINYHVSLFDLQLGGSWEYKGVVKVDSKVTRATKEIVLNSKEIDVQSAEVLGADGLCLNSAPGVTGPGREWLTIPF